MEQRKMDEQQADLVSQLLLGAGVAQEEEGASGSAAAVGEEEEVGGQQAEPEQATGGQPLGEETLEGGVLAADLRASRDDYWDNVKGVCVLLVLCCHCVLFGSALEDHLMNLGSLSLLGGLVGALFTLSIVVMPGLCFVSGLLSSEDIAVPRRKKQLLQMGVTCCIMQLASALPYAIVTHTMPLFLYGAAGVQWFLVCLLFWRLTLPFWMALRWPLAVSVVLGVLVNFLDAANAYFHQFWCFLPFFLAGHLTRRAGGKDALKKYRRRCWRIFFFAVLALAVTLLSLAAPRPPSYEGAPLWFQVIGTLSSTYNCLMAGSAACQAWPSVLLRVAYYLLAVPLIPAFLGLIPEKRVCCLTRAGRFSMYIYLLHMSLIQPWVTIAPRVHGALYIVGSAVYAFGLWALLGTGCARLCCRWCVEPRVDWFVDPEVAVSWRQRPEGEAGASAQAVAEAEWEPGVAAQARGEGGEEAPEPDDETTQQTPIVVVQA